jgi:ribosomal-protein-alanine N-acetyltransferase
MPITKSKRLTIRQLTHEDITALKPILSDPEVMKYSMRGVCDEQGIIAMIDGTIKQLSEYGFCVWGVIDTESNELVGISGLLPYDLNGEAIVHINYRFARNHWRKGYAVEAVNAVLTHAFEQLSLKTVYAVIEDTNVQSVKLAKKAGFVFLRQDIFMDCAVDLYHKTCK